MSPIASQPAKLFKNVPRSIDSEIWDIGSASLGSVSQTLARNLPFTALCPVECRAPVKARPERSEADQHAWMDETRHDALVIENRQRAGGRIAVQLDVVGDLLGRQLEILRHCLDDAKVGLVD